MQSHVAMVLGRSVWTKDGESWRREVPEEPAAGATQAVARVCEMLSYARSGGTVLVFEPCAMAHQGVETPNVRRSVFATLARVRSEHPVVASEGLGWGIEKPELAPGGAYSTLMHYELAPGISHLCDACALSGSRPPTVWSAYTVAAACANSRPRRPASLRRGL